MTFIDVDPEPPDPEWDAFTDWCDEHPEAQAGEEDT